MINIMDDHGMVATETKKKAKQIGKIQERESIKASKRKAKAFESANLAADAVR